MGLNKYGVAADSGITYDPDGRNVIPQAPDKPNYEPLVNIIFWLLVLTGMGLAVFYFKYKEGEKL